MKKQLMKTIIAIVAASAVAVLAIVTSVNAAYSKRINVSQQELADSITKDVYTYLTDYVSAAPTSSEITDLQLRVSSLENESNQNDVLASTLTDAQIQAIINSVNNQVQPALMKEITSKFSTLKKETITEMESNLETEVKEILKDTPVSDEQLKNITNSVEVIVEANILKKVQEDYKALDSSLKTLQANIEEKLNEISKTLSNYEERIAKLENVTNTMSETVTKYNTSSQNNTEQLEKSLAALQNSYSQYIQTAVTITNIVTAV